MREVQFIIGSAGVSRARSVYVGDSQYVGSASNVAYSERSSLSRFHFWAPFQKSRSSSSRFHF